MTEFAWRGTVDARGFVLDLAVIGEGEARRRVLRLLDADTEVFAVDEATWLVLLAGPTRVRAILSPGTPLVADGRGALASAPAPQDAWHAPVAPTGGASLAGQGATAALSRDIAVLRGGEWVSLDRGDLRQIDPSEWIDLGDVEHHRLEPVAAPLTASPATVDVPRQPPVDLRRASGVGAPSPEQLAVMRSMGVGGGEPAAARSRRKRPTRRSRRTVSAGGSLGRLGGGGSRLGRSVGSQLRRLFVRLRLSLDVPGRDGASSGVPARPPASSPRPLRDRTSWLVKLVLRSPARDVLGRKHSRYIRELLEQLDRKEWDTALRAAVPLGRDGMPTTGLSLRLPRGWSALTPSLSRGGPGGSLPWGMSVHEELQARYRAAAEALEREGRIEEAAFVLVDLLGTPSDAVGLLERHRRWELAARIADGHHLEADLRVRLWWLSGDRAQAVRIARRTGAFAGAIFRLEAADDPTSADLRAEAMQAHIDAGEHLAAAQVAWPVVALRSGLAPVLDEGLAVGGRTRPALLAYRVALRPSAEHRAEVLSTLAGWQDGSSTASSVSSVSSVSSAMSAATALSSAMADIPCDDAATDRELCTAAVRAIVAMPERQGSGDVLRKLMIRADPTLVADLPRGAKGRSLSRGSVVAMDVTAREPGLVPVRDAAALANGSVLVALGELGLRLLTADGRTAARWSVATHELCVSDSGTRVLLIARRDDLVDVHRLDLLTRKVAHWLTLRVTLATKSYDGLQWIVVDNRGLAVLDTTVDNHVVLWRELDDRVAIHEINRSPSSLSARIVEPVDVDPDTEPQLRQWSMPSFLLRQRPAVTANGALLASGRIVDSPGLEEVLASQELWAIVNDRAESVSIVGASSTADMVRMEGLDGVGFRASGSLVTVWDRRGRVVALDMEQRAVLANVRLSD